MLKNHSIAHKFFIFTGIILAIACMVTSSFPSIEYSSSYGWNMNDTRPIGNFDSSIFLILGIIEILLLFTSNHALRRLALFISLAKIFLPWFSFCANNFLGSLMTDASFKYTVLNNFPYITTFLAILLFIQHLLMYIFIYPNHK
ncbi:MAG: hypothetical protein IKK33_09545 [Lachnospiraceae bacterium]|nr:hypothetical protein [Lachnospiraceae bacterium]